LSPVRSIPMPINEAGRNLRLDLTVTGLKTDSAEGRRAARLASGATRQRRGAGGLSRRRSGVSDRRQRVPLVIEVSAAFGRRAHGTRGAPAGPIARAILRHFSARSEAGTPHPRDSRHATSRRPTVAVCMPLQDLTLSVSKGEFVFLTGPAAPASPHFCVSCCCRTSRPKARSSSTDTTWPRSRAAIGRNTAVA
jgi:hypothetical protein